MSFGRLGALGRGFGRMGGGGSSTSGGGPFLLKVDGVSFLLLVNGTDKILITGSSYVPSLDFSDARNSQYEPIA